MLLFRLQLTDFPLRINVAPFEKHCLLLAHSRLEQQPIEQILPRRLHGPKQIFQFLVGIDFGECLVVLWRLTLWRDNDAQLQPLLVQSELTQQLIPVSHTLNQVAVIGLQALDDLEKSRNVAAQDRQHNIELLKSAEQPQAVLLDMIAPSVELLVQATRTE